MKTTTKIYDYIYIIIDCILLFPFTAPVILQEYLDAGTLIYYWKLFSVSVLLCLVITKKIKPTQPLWILLIYFVYMGLLTIAKGESSFQIIMSQTITFFFLAFLAGIAPKWSFFRIIKCLFWILFLETIINTVSQLVFIDGIYLAGKNGNTICYILGMENRFVFTYITCLILGLALSHINIKYKKILYFDLLISAISLIIAWSVAAMFGIIVLGIIILFSNKLKSIISWLNTSVIIILGNIGFVFYRIHEKVLGIFSSYLNKDISSLQGRIPVWDETIIAIKSDLMFGHGWLSNEIAKNYFLGFSHPHNELLYFLFQGGIIGLGINIAFIASCFYQIKSYKGEKVYCVFIGAFFSLFTMLWFDSWTSTSYFYMIFITISSIDKINALCKNSINTESK